MTRPNLSPERETAAPAEDAALAERLRAAGLRPTRQRLALARALFAEGPRHVTAESLHAEAGRAGDEIALATVYNTLHALRRAGLLREVAIDAERAYFDTNTEPHHHFLDEASGRLTDIPADAVAIARLPAAPEGADITRVDVIVRTTPRG
jgi:Fur family iron response transcriptional regulator